MVTLREGLFPRVYGNPMAEDFIRVSFTFHYPALHILILIFILMAPSRRCPAWNVRWNAEFRERSLSWCLPSFRPWSLPSSGSSRTLLLQENSSSLHKVLSASLDLKDPTLIFPYPRPCTFHPVSQWFPKMPLLLFPVLLAGSWRG